MRLSSFFPKATHSCTISFLINALFVPKLLGKNKLKENLSWAKINWILFHAEF